MATALLRGRDRKMNRRYAALAGHYVFEPARGGLFLTARSIQYQRCTCNPRMITTPAVRVLYAGERQRKTGRRESREDVAATMGNSGSSCEGP